MQKRAKEAVPIYCRRDFGELTAAQSKATALAVAGTPLAEVAVALELDWATLTAWTRDPRYIAEVNRLRKAVWQTTTDRMRNLASKAAAVAEAALDDPNANPADRLKAALAILKIVRPEDLEPKAPADVVSVVMAEAEAEHRRAEKLTPNELDLMLTGEENPLGSLGQHLGRKLEALAAPAGRSGLGA